VRQEVIEDVIAGADPGRSFHPAQEAIVRELLGKGEGADFDLLLDDTEALARTAQVAIRWRPPDSLEANSKLRRRIARSG
jgi:hypothetical protein